MGVKFFGQYLIERGEVDEQQLRQALDLMTQRNRSIGEMAVAEALMSEESAAKVNAQQRSCDLPFGALAFELGLLSDAELESLLEVQAQEHLRLGEALVRIGALTHPRLAELLRGFDADQAEYRSSSATLPGALARQPLGAAVLDLLPKLLMRLARIRCRVGPSERPNWAASYPYCIAIDVRGTPGLSISLLGDERFSRQLAAACAGLEPGEIDPSLIEDGVCEFLNVLAGNSMAVAERDGEALTLEPPQCGIERCGARLSSGRCFELAVDVGRAALVLESI